MNVILIYFLVWSEEVLLILWALTYINAFYQDGNKFIILMWVIVAFLREKKNIYIYAKMKKLVL